MTQQEFLDNYKATHYALHRLWTRSVGTSDYVKSDWRELDNTFNRFAMEMAKSIGYTGPLLP